MRTIARAFGEMPRVRAFGVALAFVCAGLPGVARAEDGAVKKAMEDEMARSMTELHLGASPPPYYLQYVLNDVDSTYVSARLGALVSDEHQNQRRGYVLARVGSPDEDNTNSREFGGASGALLSLDDDYAALRRDLWRLSDQQYKQALDSLARKKASRAVQTAEKDKVPDFSKAPPLQLTKDHAAPFTDADRQKLKTITLALSRVFDAFPEINVSGVDGSGKLERRRLLTSEKTWTDERDSFVHIDVAASTFARDGQQLAASLSFAASDVAGLPPVDRMEAEVRALAKNLTEQRGVEPVEVGTATVLFEGEAAAQLAFMLFGSPLSGQPVPRAAGEGARDGSASLADKLGLVVAPKWLTVVDDPLGLGPTKRHLYGGFDSDDEGVAAERVTLIDKGVVKSLLMSRAPRKEIPKSNGHARGEFSPRAAPTNLFVTVTGGLDRKGLLAAAQRSAGPKGTVYVVRELGRDSGLGRGMTLQARVAFRYHDGKEEVVRGLSLEGFSPKKMKKDLIAAGKDLIVREDAASASAVVTPALVFEDVDVGKPNDKSRRLPLYPSPLALKR